MNISDSHQINCSLFGAGIGDSSVDEYVSSVLKRYGFITCVYTPPCCTMLRGCLLPSGIIVLLPGEYHCFDMLEYELDLLQ